MFFLPFFLPVSVFFFTLSSLFFPGLYASLLGYHYNIMINFFHTLTAIFLPTIDKVFSPSCSWSAISSLPIWLQDFDVINLIYFGYLISFKAEIV